MIRFPYKARPRCLKLALGVVGAQRNTAITFGNRNAEPAKTHACDNHARSRARHKLPFHLDSVTSAAGRITPRHRHRGLGIRCLYQGIFNIQGESDSTGTLAPGNAWWESDEETVVAWHSKQMPAIFLRGLLLLTDIKGEMSNILEGGISSPKSNWRLFVDQEITI